MPSVRYLLVVGGFSNGGWRFSQSKVYISRLTGHAELEAGVVKKSMSVGVSEKFPGKIATRLRVCAELNLKICRKFPPEIDLVKRIQEKADEIGQFRFGKSREVLQIGNRVT